jgi:hypothetical protein
VAGSWRRLHNEEFHNLYASLNIFRVIKLRRVKWAGHVARMGGIRNACKILVGKPEGRGHRESHRCRWEDNIRMDLGEIGWEIVSILWLRIGTIGGLL